jgi:hypothetical protein
MGKFLIGKLLPCRAEKWHDYSIALKGILILFKGAAWKNTSNELNVCPWHHNRAHKECKFDVLFC